MAISKQHEYYENRLEDVLKTMPPYVVEYIDDKMEYRSSITLFHYTRDFKLFFEWLQAEGITTKRDIKDIETSTLETLTLKEAEGFFKAIKRKTYIVSQKTKEKRQINAKTVNRLKSSLRSLFRYLTVEAEDPNNPGEPYFYRNVMQKIPVNKVKETLNERAKNITKKIFIGDADVEFLNYVQKEYEKTLSPTQLRYFKRDKERDYAILSLFLGSGIRVNELANIRLKDIDRTNLEVSVIRKGNKTDTVSVIPESMDDLMSYLDVRSDRYKAADDLNEFVFIRKGSNGSSPLTIRTIESIVEKYTKSFDKRMSPHKLRHTYATNLAEETGDIPLVMNQLGHTNSDTSLLYINTTREKAREASKRLGRRRK
ncbi:MAG: tyrosine recombinase XerS [Bacillota bacterium]